MNEREIGGRIISIPAWLLTDHEVTQLAERLTKVIAFVEKPTTTEIVALNLLRKESEERKET